MAQKDYISRARKSGQKKRTTGSRQKANTPQISFGAILALIIVVAAFAGGLYFLKYGKPDSISPVVTQQKPNTNTIPPQPPRRWVYPEVLTNPQSNSINNTGNTTSINQGMSQEQQRILSMMEADRPQIGTNTSATYNQQVGRNSQNDQQPTTPTGSDAAPTPPPATTTVTTQQPPATSATTVQQSWSLQCGSFRNKDGAEAIRAQLAFSGIPSQVVTNDGLHRVIGGPYNTREAATEMQIRAASAGINGCQVRG